MIEWDNGLSVGVEILDNDHKQLLHIINQLSEAIDANATKDTLENIFAQLQKYTQIHFTREESYIHKCHHGSLLHHQAQHNEFISKIPELKAKLLATNDYVAAQDTAVYLVDWLVNHIITEDIPLINFFENCELFKEQHKSETGLFQLLIKKTTDALSFTKRILFSVLVPLGGMLLFGTIILWSNYKEYKSMQSTSSLIYTISNINALAHNLQAERGLSSGYLTSKERKFDESLQKQRALVDETTASFINKLKTIRSEQLSVIQPYINIFHEDMLTLHNLRENIKNKQISQVDAINAYTKIVKNILTITPKIAFIGIDGEISSSISTLSSVLHIKEVLGLQRAYGTMIIEKKSVTKEEYISSTQLFSAQKSFISMFELTASQDEKERMETLFGSAFAQKIFQTQERLINSDFENLDSEIWFDSLTQLMDDVKKCEDVLLYKVNSLIELRTMQTIQNLILWLIFNTIILAVTFFILYTLKKSTTKQISQLTDAMKDLASGGRSFRLSPILINRDEIACMYDAYEVTRQRLLRGDIFTQLYKSKKEIEIKNQQRENSRLEEIASTDSLTGALNRRKFEELADIELKYALRYKHSLSFLMLDIDHFKNINDSYGHAIGDEVLQHFAAVCKNEAREIDIVARIGGEEFVMVLRETDEDGAYHFAQRLRDKVYNATVLVANETIKYTVSIGVAGLQNDISSKTILQRADEALYEAKKSGRNTTIVYKNRASLT